MGLFLSGSCCLGSVLGVVFCLRHAVCVVFVLTVSCLSWSEPDLNNVFVCPFICVFSDPVLSRLVRVSFVFCLGVIRSLTIYHPTHAPGKLQTRTYVIPFLLAYPARTVPKKCCQAPAKLNLAAARPPRWADMDCQGRGGRVMLGAFCLGS